MGLNSNEEIDAMIEDELTLKLSQLNIVPGNEERKSLKHCQRTRGIALWHDHCTVLGLGVVMITAHI